MRIEITKEYGYKTRSMITIFETDYKMNEFHGTGKSTCFSRSRYEKNTRRQEQIT